MSSNPPTIPSPDPVVAATPCGPVVESTIGDWGLATATFSEDRMYRYRLSRVWDADGTRVNFLMLNPSTADAFKLDPTVRRCMGFAESWGAGAVEVTNCYALRATQPARLRDTSDPVGPRNSEAIVAAATAADLVVIAWGVHATYLGRENEVLDLLSNAGVTPHYLRLTKGGHPGHPLYVPGDVAPTAFHRMD